MEDQINNQNVHRKSNAVTDSPACISVAVVREETVTSEDDVTVNGQY